ncbi:LOW QUALITY PROTEIN: centrosomal protein CCDC61 [Leptosomus discolor]
MGEPRYVRADCTFRPGGQAGLYSVRLSLARSALAVEAEAHRTFERWRAEFDAAFIEDLTRRTGNFKEFGVFSSMLESALTGSSKSVSLELLTYAELETLRSRKVGAIARPPPSVTSPLCAKRYLILTYSAEFDRIRYPLALPYVGRPDRAALCGLVLELREELAQLRAQHRDGHRDAEIRRLQDELQQALEQKRAAEVALRALQDGGTEATALRRALRRWEEKLLREEARHQREHRQLVAELAEAKASERRLQLRVRSLTAELASYKGGVRPGCSRGVRRTPTTAPKRAQERSASSSGRPPAHSASRESRGSSQGRAPLRSPSPAGSRPPRFDPTAFVRGRQRRQQEAKLKNQQRGAAFGSASPARSRGRSPSDGSCRSRCSAVSSGSEADEHPKPPPRRRGTRTQRPPSASSSNNPSAAPRPATGHKPRKSGTAGKAENRYEEPSAELAEIDARLQALQEYMESLDPHVVPRVLLLGTRQEGHRGEGGGDTHTRDITRGRGTLPGLGDVVGETAPSPGPPPRCDTSTRVTTTLPPPNTPQCPCPPHSGDTAVPTALAELPAAAVPPPGLYSAPVHTKRWHLGTTVAGAGTVLVAARGHRVKVFGDGVRCCGRGSVTGPPPQPHPREDAAVTTLAAGSAATTPPRTRCR